MKELYSAEMLESLDGKLKKRWILTGVVSALLLAAFVWSVVIRMEWLSILLLALLGVFLIFFIEMFCRPLLNYRKLVVSALSGRSHDREMEYVRTEPDVSSVDGVSCLSLIFLGDADKHGSREQLLYWDEEIPLPALQEGQSYTVRFTGRNIIAIGE
ncbi:MAG: hypothetical protein IJL36_06110 [Clostridia bacterium]|nr:hypothetical protein [Clostridia bacterium]